MEGMHPTDVENAAPIEAQSLTQADLDLANKVLDGIFTTDEQWFEDTQQAQAKGLIYWEGNGPGLYWRPTQVYDALAERLGDDG